MFLFFIYKSIGGPCCCIKLNVKDLADETLFCRISGASMSKSPFRPMLPD
jgi:hypothetical protein